ncbi:zinc finger, PHD-type containing protein [Tanacetum coccineum]
MTWHATGKCTEPGKMQHPVDGRAWKNFDTKYLDFAKEPRNVRLGLAADGFNPFGNLSQSYSMWPVILTTYNLPPWLCMKESSFMLTLLIPGPKSPGKDIDVYLRPLIDDLKDLWALKGVETIDVATGQKFNMRAMVLWTINDFPARSSLSGWSGQGYKACPTCNEDTPSMRVLGKTTYVGHRRFLKKPHKWRRSLDFNGETKDGDPPRKFDRDQIMAQLARLPTRVKGKHPRYGGVKIKRNVLVELNWTKRSIFYELEYWSFLTLKHNLDIMHIEKNVLESILNTLLMNDKSKDTTKARQDLKRLGIRSGLWFGQNKNEKCSKPQVAYSFIPENRKKFCQFIKGDKLLDGFGSNFKNKVTDNDTNITGLKSHDCHIMMQHLLPYGLQKYLPADVAKPIIKICSFFKQICSQTLMEDDMLKAQSKVVYILCNLELIYPPAFFDIMIHLVIHLPLEALEGGPIRPWHNTMVPVQVKAMKTQAGVQVIRFDHQELKKVIWYVLHNSPEIDTYQAKFKSEFPNQDMKEEFPGWFGSQIRKRHIDKDPGVSTSSELFALACEPTPTLISVNSCIVNGARLKKSSSFHICRSKFCCSELSGSTLAMKDVKSNVLSLETTWHKTRQVVVEDVNHNKFLNGGVIVVEDDHDVIYFDNSSDLALFTSLNDLDFATLHIDGQSIDVDAPPNIIDVDEDDDIIDDEDTLPHDLADSDDEDIINVDNDDDVAVVYSNVARGHEGDSGGDDRPPLHQIGGGCQGKGTRKPNLGGRKADRLNTRVLDALSFLAQHPGGEKGRVMGKIGTQFDLTPHMQSDLWPKIKKGIEQHLAKIYTDNKSSLKAEHWVANPEDGTYDVEGIRS